MLGVLDLNQSGAISVQQFLCVVVRKRNAQCMKCAEACTSGCISLLDGQLAIDASLCVGCGTCATVCPTCALEAHNPSDAELLATCLDNATDTHSCTIVCHPLAEALGSMLDTSLVAEVVCLGRVEEALLVNLVAEGIEHIQLVCGNCAQCAQKLGLDCARLVADSASELLMMWKSPVRVNVTDALPSEVLVQGISVTQAQAQVNGYFEQERANPPIRIGARENIANHDTAEQDTPEQDTPEQDTPAQPSSDNRPQVLKVMKDGTLPHFIPARRERLLDALARIGNPREDALRTRLWGQVRIDSSKCVSCRMCATFCPTGAIAKYGKQDSDDFGVEHYPGDCVKCNTCRDICPADAITILDDVQAPFLLGGEVHAFPMLPRAVELNNEHQIINTVRSFIDGDIFER